MIQVSAWGCCRNRRHVFDWVMNDKLPPLPDSLPSHVLDDAGVNAWMGPRSLPLWIDDPDWRYFATLDSAAARSQGFTTRPLVETLRDSLATERMRTDKWAGLTDEDERDLRLRLE